MQPGRNTLVPILVVLALSACRRSGGTGALPDSGSGREGGPGYVPAGEIYDVRVAEGYLVEMPPPAVSGGVAEEAARDATRPALGKVEACYVASLSGKPDLAGEMRLAMTVGQDGSAGEVVVRSDTTGDARLAGCAGDVLAGIAFPAGAAGEVVVTFRFSPHGDGGSQ